MTLSITIAIPTLNRHPQLAETLHHLCRIDLSSVQEILIIDQTDTFFDIKPWHARFSVPIRVIQPPVKGLCAARNIALQETTTDLILYLDDDVIPDCFLVEQHLKTYYEYPNAIGTAGAEKIAEESRAMRAKQRIRRWIALILRPYFSLDPYYSSFLDSTGYPVSLITRSGVFLCYFNHSEPCRVMTPRGCNMSFRCDSLRAIGGFDEGFIGNGRREESDMSLRLLKAFPGSEIWYNPKATLIHLMSPTGGCRSDNREQWYRDLFHCETRFAYRHLKGLGKLIFRVYFFLRHLQIMVQYPVLFREFWSAKGGAIVTRLPQPSEIMER
ncbi:MAG: glycosyltransferase [Leptolyngbyaceae cyanobacterium bins.59]|nr:glycosyltransferase [Leptolyngbyaceae cyanobacterium bins.59]